VVQVEIIMTDNKRSEDSENRGMDGLTEVLRLQAEALSRISERMAGMRGSQPESAPIPPPPPVYQGLGRESGSLPVLARDPVLSDDSLPVLNTFKNFLEQERRHARKRLLWVLLSFTMIFSGVLSVIVWLNGERSREIKSEIVQTNARAERSRLDSEAELKRLGENMSNTATQNVSQMRKDITRNILWAHSVLASNVSSELSGRDSETERLKEKISSIEIENAMLARQIEELGKRLNALESHDLGGMNRDVLDLEMLLKTNRTATLASPTPVIINSAKYGRSFQLRMPQE